jgi:L-lactate dehydrogenase (cytochrome)
MSVINSIADLRELARRRIPRAIFEYADRGSYDELTLARNRTDLRAIQFRQRVMRDLSQVSVASTMLGQRVTMPLAIAPTGLTGLFRGDGEIHGARAAQAFGIPFCLSTMSICSIEDVREAVPAPFWFQVYLMRDRGFNQELIARARAAQCSALVLTVDLQVQGLRRRDPKNGLSIPPRLTLRNALDIAFRPAWALSVLLGKRRTFGNLAARVGNAGLSTLSEWIASQFNPGVTWQEVDWIRSLWPGKLILKGILDADDARIAAELEIDAMVVSNHGGRQLDGAPLPHGTQRDYLDWLDEQLQPFFRPITFEHRPACPPIVSVRAMEPFPSIGHAGSLLRRQRQPLRFSIRASGCQLLGPRCPTIQRGGRRIPHCGRPLERRAEVPHTIIAIRLTQLLDVSGAKNRPRRESCCQSKGRPPAFRLLSLFHINLGPRMTFTTLRYASGRPPSSTRFGRLTNLVDDFLFQ